MSCRYTRVLAQCSQLAAEWQLMFTRHVTNTFPNVYQYVVHPGSADVTDITNCDGFWLGRLTAALQQLVTEGSMDATSFHEHGL